VCKIWGFHGGDYEECHLPELLHHVAHVRTDILEVHITSIIRVTIGNSCHPDDGGDTFLRTVGSYKSHMV
jgi:hypothetical protein